MSETTRNDNKAYPIWIAITSYLLLPNLAFLALGHFVYLMRPIVNIDYLLLGMLAPWLAPIVSGSLFAALLANELLINLAPIYRFDISQAIHWASGMQFISWRYSLPKILFLIAGCTGITFFTTRMGKRHQGHFRSASFLLALAVTAASLDIANGTSFLPGLSQRAFMNVNVAYSGARRSILALKSAHSGNGTIQYQPLKPADAASGELLASARTPGIPLPRQQVALVVVESMGLFTDPTVADRLLEPLRTPEIAARYEIEVRSAPFHGSTIDGEFRELCGVRLLNFGDQGIPKCLPHYLHEQGFETTALHGFTNLFYDRYRWYPELGFDHVLFAQDMRKMDVTETCGSGFKGICDLNVAELLHQELLRGTPAKPRFIYWMTLNSHLPLDLRPITESAFDCQKSPLTRHGSGVCKFSKTVSRVIERLALIAADPALPATQFIITGDHAAPFLSPDRRSLFSESEVPVIILRPRKAGSLHLAASSTGSR